MRQFIAEYISNKWVRKMGSKAEADESKSSSKHTANYFQQAKSWADDIYTATIVSRNRYKIAFLSMAGLSMLLTLCICMLIPAQHTELVVVHQGDSGYTWLSITKPHEKLPQNLVRTRAEIAHYVMARESYDPLLYGYQTKDVNLFNTPEIQAEYEMAQDVHNKTAPINLLADKGYRTVLINNIMMLDSRAKNKTKSDKHVNLAQVDFVVEDHFFDIHRTIKIPYTAIMSWRHEGIPSDAYQKLKNWDGFKVTKYVVQPVNVHG